MNRRNFLTALGTAYGMDMAASITQACHRKNTRRCVTQSLATQACVQPRNPYNITQGLIVYNTSNQNIQASFIRTWQDSIVGGGWYNIEPGQRVEVYGGEFFRNNTWFAIWNPAAGAYAPVSSFDADVPDSNGRVSHMHCVAGQAYFPTKAHSLDFHNGSIVDGLYDGTGWVHIAII